MIAGDPIEGHTATPPRRRQTLAILGGGFAAASAIMILAVLPAEFHIDPTGFGAATGLMALSAPPAGRPAPASPLPRKSSAPAMVARDESKAFRTDVIDIPMKPGGFDGSELEYKVHMVAGQTLVYAWTVAAPKDEFYADFHSEQRPAPKENVISHKVGLMTASNGSLTAPFEGIHGWYLQNQSAKPVVVHLKLSGYYDLLPKGQPPQ